MIWTAKDGSPRILLALQRSIYANNLEFWPEVREVDVATGRSKLVLGSRQGIMNWTADGSGTIRMGSGRSLDGRELRVVYRSAAGERFREIVRATREREAVVTPAVFLAEADRALAFADDPAGFGGLYEYDLSTLTLGKRLYDSPGFDLGGIITNERDDTVLGVNYLEDRARRHWIDPILSAMQGEVAARW